MAGNVDKVQLQVEVVRTQLDTLIKDVNSLKEQKIKVTVDSSGMEAINQFNRSVQTMVQNVDSLRGKFTQHYEQTEKAAGKAAAAAEKASQRAYKAEQQRFTNAKNSIPALQKQYADLANSIAAASAKYPKGTFDGLSERVAQARTELDALANGVKDGSSGFYTLMNSVEDAKSGLAGLRSEFSQTKADTEKLQKSTNVLGDSLGNILKKVAAWQVFNATVATVIRSFKEALATMKEVDTELVAIQKVTNNTDAEMASLSEHAYEVASQYGVAVADYLESVGTFAKAGYKEMSEDMAELATKTQLVGDVNSATANQFLLSADAAYKMKGNVEELSGVLDRANEIENKYATSIQKLAEGFPIVANVASMANMSIDETMAALGTITAVTQESGSKAATALRALILNIIGDTETEIEDGVTWTKEEIEGLNDVLWIYAEDAMKAADAAGKIVDPMKAVAALAEAYKDGVLTQAQLAEIETKLGGKLRTNQLDALIKNYDMYAEMLDKVASAAGSADKEVGIMLTSWEAKTNQLKNTWTEFIAKTIDTSWIKGLVDALTWLIDGFDNLGNVLLIVSGFLLAAKWNSVVATFVKIGSAVSGLVTIFKTAGVSASSFSAVMQSLNISLSATQLAIGAVTAAIGILIFAVNKIKSAQEEARQKALEAGKAAAREAEEIQSLYQTYSDLKSSYETGAGSKKDFEDATDRLLKKLGYEKESVDDLTAKYGSLDEAIRASTESALEAALYDAKAATIAAEKALIAAAEDTYGSQMAGALELDSAEAVIKDYQKNLEARKELIDAGKQDATKIFGENQYSSNEKLINGVKSAVEDYNTAIANQTELENKLQAVRDGTLDSYGRENELLEENNQLTDENNQKTSEKVSKIQEYGKALKTQQSDLAAVSAALGEYRINGNISASTLQSLIGLSDKYVEMLTDEDGQLRITEESLKAVASAILEDVDATQQQIGASSSADEAAAKFVSSLLDVAENAGYSGKALYDLALEIIKLNETGLDLSAQIAQVVALGRAAGATAASIASISGIKSSDADRTIKGWIQTGQVGSYEEGEQKLLQGIYDSFDYSESSWNKSGSSGSKGSGSGGGGSSSDATLTAHKERVTLLKSELTLLEKQGASEDAQKAKMREIQDALSAQADYMRSIGASQADINDLSSEWYDWQKKIKEQTKSMDDLLSELKDAMQDSLSSQQDARDAELAALDAQLDALKRQKETKDDQLTLEEKILAVQKAQADLANAQNERTVRQWNASTGQWEWVADEGNVKSAKDSLEKAEKDLKDFQDDLAYNAAVAEIEARKDAINAQYDALERQYNNFLDSLKAKTRGIGEILQDIWKNATPELKKIILENADIFRQFGVDVSKLSDAVNETANRIVKVGADGKAPSGLSVGDRVVTGGGTYEIIGVNPDGTYQSQLVDKNQTTYNYGGQYDAPPGGDSSGGSGGSGGSGSGLKYSGTVYAYAQDGSRYTISSKKGLDFLNYEAAGARMTGGDGTSWLKNYDGTTSITKKDGKVYTVYDRGGILEGIGGIKATAEPEMVLPPDITRAIQNMLLVPQADARFERGMDRMRAALCGDLRNSNVFAGSTYDDHHVGTQQNGCSFYSFGGVTISEGRARGMSVADFARSAATLAIQKNM
jgi:TP901 family phage tail tape measure protein